MSTSEVDRPPSTKEELDWFQKRRERWNQAPRVKVRRLPPLSPIAASLASLQLSPASITTTTSPNNTISNKTAALNAFSSTTTTTTTTTSSTNPFSNLQLVSVSNNNNAPSPAAAAPVPPVSNNKAPEPFSFGGNGGTSSVRQRLVPPLPATSTSNGMPLLGGASTISKTPSSFGVTQQQEQQQQQPLCTPSNDATTSTTATDSLNKKEETTTSLRERLIAFYKVHNPAKLDTVDATLDKYQGQPQEVLFNKLNAKYGVTTTTTTTKSSKFPVPSGQGPTCFLDMEGYGRVTIQLFADKTPLAAENFKSLCTGEKGMGRSGKALCYQFSKVHRIVPGFCVQLGDFTRGDGRGGESIYPPNSEHGDAWGKFKDEAFMQHCRKGLLSMANNGPARNSSQFFVTLRAVPDLDGKHVVFGEVVEGMDVIEKISMIPTNDKQYPTEPVTVLNCGEIRDGKEISSAANETTATTKSSPFAFSSSSFTSTTTPNPFSGFTSSTSNTPSPFGFSSVASSTPATTATTTVAGSGTTPFSFSSSSNPRQVPFTTSPSTAATGSVSGTSPFSLDSSTQSSTPLGAGSPFSFGAAAAAAPSTSFTFGAIPAASTSAGASSNSKKKRSGGESPSSFGQGIATSEAPKNPFANFSFGK